MSFQTTVIIPAAGSGQRFGSHTKKQFLTLEGKSLLERTIEIFDRSGLVDRIVVCLPADEIDSLFLPQTQTPLVKVLGGNSRSESVHRGVLQAAVTGEDRVLIHDAVRCLLSTSLIRRVLQALDHYAAVVPALLPVDTVKEVSEDQVIRTIPRQNLRLIQTPQGFHASVLRQAYEKLDFANSLYTDESMLVEALGIPVYTVEGEKNNLKITSKEDWFWAETLLK